MCSLIIGNDAKISNHYWHMKGKCFEQPPVSYTKLCRDGLLVSPLRMKWFCVKHKNITTPQRSCTSRILHLYWGQYQTIKTYILDLCHSSGWELVRQCDIPELVKRSAKPIPSAFLTTFNMSFKAWKEKQISLLQYRWAEYTMLSPWNNILTCNPRGNIRMSSERQIMTYATYSSEPQWTSAYKVKGQCFIHVANGDLWI